MCDYRSALRKATAPLHREIDALFGTFDLGQHDGLARFLMAQAIGMQACQPSALRFGKNRLGCSPPDYMQALTTDLAAMGIATAGLPRLELPEGAEDAGVFYVVAGSRMGAAVLRARATAATPDGPANRVCSFFAPGEGVAIWQLFRAWLGAQSDATPSGLPAMIDTALATFRIFGAAGQWAARQPVAPATGFAA